MTRWVFSYRVEGSRTLSDLELETLRQFERLSFIKVWLTALASILMGIAMLISISIFAVQMPWGMVGFVAVVAGFLWVFSRVSVIDRSRLLYKRAIRRKEVETCVREEAPDTVRAILSRSSDEEETEAKLEGDLDWRLFWEAEERFFKRLTRVNGKLPDRIELLKGDGVVLLVDGSIIRDVMNVPVVSIDGPIS